MADVRMSGSGKQAVVGNPGAPIMVYKDGDEYFGLGDEFAKHLVDNKRATIIVEEVETSDDSNPDDGNPKDDDSKKDGRKPWQKILK